MYKTIHTVVLPVRPQPDTLVAIFILKQFGQEKFPGIETAQFAFWPTLPVGQNSEQLFQAGYLLVDLGDGDFDHHQKIPATTSANLVAEFLGVDNDAALNKLLEYARRDDFFGKGTVSADPIDRALGLSGLIAALNKTWPQNPEHVIALILPLIAAHHQEENRRATEFPREVDSKRAEGKVREFSVRQKDRNLKIIMIESDNVGLPGYLRSQMGGRYDVVAQRTEAGYVNILTRPTKRVDLRSLAALLRLREEEKAGYNAAEKVSDLLSPGRLTGTNDWYYDMATNSLLNGGMLPSADIVPTRIGWPEELEKILCLGLSEKLLDPKNY